MAIYPGIHGVYTIYFTLGGSSVVTTVTFLLGLAGSGKTHRAKELKRSTGAEIFDGVFGPDNTHKLEGMLASLKASKNCTVEEIAYCDAANRPSIVTLVHSANPTVQVIWECFENDMETANWNVCNRCDPEKQNVFGHLALNAHWTGRYTYPEGSLPKKIFRMPRKKQ
jgi:hypothetical protein